MFRDFISIAAPKEIHNPFEQLDKDADTEKDTKKAGPKKVIVPRANMVIIKKKSVVVEAKAKDSSIEESKQIKQETSSPSKVSGNANGDIVQNNSKDKATEARNGGDAEDEDDDEVVLAGMRRGSGTNLEVKEEIERKVRAEIEAQEKVDGRSIKVCFGCALAYASVRCHLLTGSIDV